MDPSDFPRLKKIILPKASLLKPECVRPLPSEPPPNYRWARSAMVERLRAQGITHPAILSAMNTLARELFIDEALRMRVYDDCSLPIGQGQTLSQPYIVARMTEILLAASRPVKRVLEIGTGSGYQAAVLAQCGCTVFTIERIEPFLAVAKLRHRALGLLNIRYLHRDGFNGWPSQAPFDGIIVTAAPAEVPVELIAQLAVGGRLIVPVGAQGATQRLTLITRTATSHTRQPLDACSFVPMLCGEQF
ncbi:MAG: protein-L-isoaspartate O-methyltransferase [Halothiobacillus sp. 20-53-49]|nr:MAG: protein-L-isoaspartate O-methyltransferase [Halothiobacillus sp. 20-53-49]